MNPEMAQAATGAAARVVSANQLYRTCLAKSTTINELLARLMFSLASPHITLSERTGIFDVIDGLLRLKIDVGLLKGAQHE